MSDSSEDHGGTETISSNGVTRASAGYPPVYALYDDKEIDLLDLWRVLVEQRWVIMAIMLCITVLAVAYAFLKTPVYEADVLMVPMSDEQDSGRLASLMGAYSGLASLAGIEFGGGSDMTEESIATLSSREFTGRFIADNSLLPVLFEDDWDADAGRWDVDDPDDVPTSGDAFELFDEEVRTVTRDKTTGLITLSIEWKDRDLAAHWANELVRRVNKHRQQEAIEEARKSIAYLDKQLEETNVVEMQQAIYRLIEAQTKTIMLANVREEYAFKVIDPAVVPDEDDFAKPQRALVIALGFVGGLMLGVLAAFLRNFIQAQTEKAA